MTRMFIVAVLVVTPLHGGDLLPPVPIEANGKPIDVMGAGHAAPFLGDITGDGLRDLLVGQFAEGRLRIYTNVGSRAKPKFNGFSWFEAGDRLGRVPTG